jgi:predicted nucleic acid-binding protein
MFKLLIDTSVWLDLAKPEKEIMLDLLEDVLNVGEVSLILPRTVLVEFARKREKVIRDGSHHLSDAFKRVKAAVWNMERTRRRRHLFDRLSDLEHKLPTVGDAIAENLAKMEKLFERAVVVEATDAIKLRAAQRAIDSRAPFHRSKNSMGDAIIIETYAECVQGPEARGHRFGFVTHDGDFGNVGVHEKKPHPDVAGLFSKIKSRYFADVQDALHAVAPSFVSEMKTWRERREDSRSATEISDAIGELMDKIGYNRMQMTLERIALGELRVVEKETYPRPRGRGRETIARSVVDGIGRSLARREKQYGKKSLGPWSDFDWGVLNGKLMALRWVFGQEWDDPEILSL